ncbi:MAG: hypothetical protein OEM82_03285 [Acidobacteriota bacterium]|nr:hypothetical protein [Acidobacteriota bacterium]MDH3528142.1 hypothetical protein [Acidobacteriota bacterium]
MAKIIPTKAKQPGDPTRNQLTLIVAVVILVVVAIAVALAFAAPTLTNTQKWVFIGILVVFPFFSIALLTWLILRHSRKLIVSSNDSALEWETTSPEKQKRKLNTEVKELSMTLGLSTEQLTDLRSAYIVAEDLALRKVQNETNVPMMRKIDIANSDFDAIWIDHDLITLVDVTFVVVPTIDQKKINRVLRKASAAKSSLEKLRKGSRVRLLLVIVTQLDEVGEAELRSNVKTTFRATTVDVDIRFLDFLALQNTYAED